MKTIAPGVPLGIGVFSTPLLETLEPRIAPAILVNPTTVIYQDVDGDMVTVKFSKAVLSDDPVFLETVFGKDFVDGNADDPQQLESLDLTDPVFANVSLKITAKAGPIGDGFVNVGEILAAGNDLGKVEVNGDLGRITAGDGDFSTLGLKFLRVESLGRFGTSTGAADLVSTVEGGIGKFVVRGDVFEARMLVDNGKVGAIQIGGSLIGGQASTSGQILVQDGDIGKVSIGGNLQGGEGNLSGRLIASGDLGKVSIGGNLQGGGGTASGFLQAIGDLGKVSIGGNLQGGAGEFSGSLGAIGDLGKVSIGGNLQGGEGNSSGRVTAHSDLGKVFIGGNLQGGEGADSGQIRFENGDLGKLSIGGNLQGGEGTASGSLQAVGDIGKVSIGGNLQGGAGLFSGTIAAFVGGDLQQAVIKGSIFSGDGQSSGAIRIDGAMGKLHVAGGLMGDAANSVLITAGAGGDMPSIGSLSIGGSVEHTLILAGYGTNPTPNAKVGDAGIGKVVVGGDWIASSLVAGAKNTDFPKFGDANDSVIAGGDPDILSRIASITVKGYVMGTVGGADHFGFVAEEIGKVAIGGNKGFVPAPGFTPLGATGDFNIHVL